MAKALLDELCLSLSVLQMSLARAFAAVLLPEEMLAEAKRRQAFHLVRCSFLALTNSTRLAASQPPDVYLLFCGSGDAAERAHRPDLPEADAPRRATAHQVLLAAAHYHGGGEPPYLPSGKHVLAAAHGPNVFQAQVKVGRAGDSWMLSSGLGCMAFACVCLWPICLFACQESTSTNPRAGNDVEESDSSAGQSQS